MIFAKNELGDRSMEQKEVLTLLSRVRNGDSDAFALLSERFEGMTNKLVRQFSIDRCEADCAELLQEARLALYRAACTYRNTENVTFGLYARVCVRNALVSFCRRAVPSGISFCDIDALLLSDEREPVDPLVEAERIAELTEMMGRVLSPYEQQVFARLLDGEEVVVIAEVLGKSEKSVANAVFRIQSKMRTALGK